ncbi:hypothetical protein, variant [Capsaspora owczarzaki ATCC 30864]|uniref:Uncharacterized protein n=1 Tax=Capsaspora owczarzaki (strain ATCC 30864) TaxID=595528 RepID=A0A0D2WJJ4_CAPO3|nr:hypothetical protein, variant [Capsaspora owczarzaki ATCC 30864]
MTTPHVRRHRLAPLSGLALIELAQDGRLDELFQLLRDFPPVVNMPSANGETLLHYVCREGRVDIMNRLLDMYEPPSPTLMTMTQGKDARVGDLSHNNHASRQSDTDACRSSDERVVLDWTAATRGRRQTPLACACIQGQAAIVALLRQRCPDTALALERLLQTDSESATPLHLAVGSGSLELCRTILERQCDVGLRRRLPPSADRVVTTEQDTSTNLDASTDQGIATNQGIIAQQGIETASTHRQLAELVETPPATSALPPDLGSLRLKAKSPLHLAASKGFADLIHLLIDYGDDMNEVHIFLRTPLLFATYFGEAACVAALLERGADVQHRDENGSTGMHYAALRSHVDSLSVLIQHGGDVNAQTDEKSTPLHHAAIHSSKPCLELLLENGALPDPVDDLGSTPLMEAVKSPSMRLATLQFLLERGARVNAVDSSMNTGLGEGFLPLFGLLWRKLTKLEFFACAKHPQYFTTPRVFSGCRPSSCFISMVVTCIGATAWTSLQRNSHRSGNQACGSCLSRSWLL